MQTLAKSAADNLNKIKERHLIRGNLEIFAEILSIFLKKRIWRP